MMVNFFKGKDILVTGGCGSIGSVIVKRLLDLNPKRVRVFDNDEAGHFRLNQGISVDKGHLVRNLVGDIRDRDRVMRAMERVDIVFHAAALKHVPFCEDNPFEAVLTNVVGTQNLVDAAIFNKVKVFVGISSDKAVNPINTMGATKLLSEKLITNATTGFSKCKFFCVRFGNVLNSVGSVIPIFKKQIENGGPVTITSDKMTRFFMSIDDAVGLVLKTVGIAKGGEVFILKMRALKIIDLAKEMVWELAVNPEKIRFNIIGIRSGEKLHESLVTEEESKYMSEVKDMYVLYNSTLSGYRRFNGLVSDYNSRNAPLLSLKEIKKLVRGLVL